MGAIVARPPSAWSYLIPGMFIIDFLRRGSAIRKYTQHFMFPRKLAVDAARAVSQGEDEASVRSHVEKDTGAWLSALNLYSEELLKAHLAFIDVLIEHYSALLNAEGDSYYLLVGAAYQNRENFQSFLEKITAAENEALARAEQAGRGFNPELGLEVENFIGSGDFSGFSSAEYTLFLAQTFQLGGKLSKQREAAGWNAEMVRLEARLQALDLQAQVTRVFVEILPVLNGSRHASHNGTVTRIDVTYGRLKIKSVISHFPPESDDLTVVLLKIFWSAPLHTELLPHRFLNEWLIDMVFIERKPFRTLIMQYFLDLTVIRLKSLSHAPT